LHVNAQYRRLTAERRADHVEVLVALGRLLDGLPTTQLVRRSFLVMTVAGQ